MKVLVVNDDGINSQGIKELVKKLLKYDYEIMVVAPTSEKSAASHSLTLRRGLALIKYKDIFEGIPTYSIDGSPADCVKFAYHALNFDFDIVLSGVNNGLNMGNDIIYSGTVAGASEAGFFNKKGIALSSARNDLTGFLEGFDLFWEKFIKSDLFKASLVYNVNFPKNNKGVKVTCQGGSHFDTKFIQEKDELYYSKGQFNFLKGSNDIHSDLEAYHSGYISITPLTNDRTNINIFHEFQDFRL